MIEVRPTLQRTKGKWYVCITVPTHLRDQLNGRKQMKLSTGTSDRVIAERKFVSLANKLLVRLEEAAGSNHPLIIAAQEIINLTPEITTGYSAEQLLDPATHWDAIADIKSRATYVEKATFMGRGDPETAILITAAQEAMANALIEFEKQLEIYRPNVSQISQTRSSQQLLTEILEEWMASLQVGRLKTKSSYRHHVERFISSVGDLPITAISKGHANEFVNELSVAGFSNSTIETAVAALRGMMNYALDLELVEANPFSNLRIRGKGKPPQARSTLSRRQLEALLQLPMKKRDRLCLTILAATGMRLDEAALLNYEDVKIDDDTGIRYFDLTGKNKILKNRKNSPRQIPIPDALQVPFDGSGRMFDYATDKDGKAQNAASKALMQHIRKIKKEPDENLVVHSLRHTYKDMLRDSGIPKDLQDFLLGHAATSVGESYGQGYSLKAKKEAVEKLDLSFLYS